MVKTVLCAGCSNIKEHYGKGFCKDCYYKIYPRLRHSKRLITCACCGQLKTHVAKGLCGHCYDVSYMSVIIDCARCGKETNRRHGSLCSSCYYLLHPRTEEVKQRERERQELLSWGEEGRPVPFDVKNEITCGGLSRDDVRIVERKRYSCGRSIIIYKARDESGYFVQMMYITHEGGDKEAWWVFGTWGDVQRFLKQIPHRTFSFLTREASS